MSETTILVPVRYPLRTASVQTLQRAAEIAAERNGTHLFVLHVNLIQAGEDVSRSELQRSVESKAGPLPTASYHVRDAFLLEEAILNEVGHQNVDYVVIGRSRRARWRRLLANWLGIGVDLEAFLQKHLSGELIVV